MTTARASFEFVVPGPPVPKARARVSRGRSGGKAHGYTPDETVEYESRVRSFALRALADWKANNGRDWPSNAAQYRLSCQFLRPPKAKGDLANYVKAVEDALNPRRGMARAHTRIVWPDDAMVTAYGPTFVAESDKPCTRVVVEVIS